MAPTSVSGKTSTSDRYCTLGRISIAYIAQWGIIRVVHSTTGELLRTDSVGKLNDQSWGAIITKYRRLMNEEM